LKGVAANFGLVSKAGYQVLITDEGFARKLATKYGAELEKTDDGWLVKKPIPAHSDDDPIVMAIKHAIEGLR
jgi:hypothetical protein